MVGDDRIITRHHFYRTWTLNLPIFLGFVSELGVKGCARGSGFSSGFGRAVVVSPACVFTWGILARVAAPEELATLGGAETVAWT